MFSCTALRVLCLIMVVTFCGGCVVNSGKCGYIWYCWSVVCLFVWFGFLFVIVAGGRLLIAVLCFVVIGWALALVYLFGSVLLDLVAGVWYC